MYSIFKNVEETEQEEAKRRSGRLKKLSTVDEQFVKVKSLRNKKKVRAKT